MLWRDHVLQFHFPLEKMSSWWKCFYCKPITSSRVPFVNGNITNFLLLSVQRRKYGIPNTFLPILSGGDRKKKKKMFGKSSSSLLACRHRCRCSTWGVMRLLVKSSAPSSSYLLLDAHKRSVGHLTIVDPFFGRSASPCISPSVYQLPLFVAFPGESVHQDVIGVIHLLPAPDWNFSSLFFFPHSNTIGRWSTR